MLDDCTALILAGGSSTRMGRDKTMLEFDGKTLLQRAVDAMRSIFPEVTVSVRAPRPDLDVPQICDETAGAGPLAGLCAGLAQAKTPWVFALAVDMPFMTADMVARLALRRGHVQAVVPISQGFPQPLAAFYAKEALPVFRAAMAGEGTHSVRSALEKLSVCWVDEESLREFDPGQRGFLDLDTPEDLARISLGGKYLKD